MLCVKAALVVGFGCMVTDAQTSAGSPPRFDDYPVIETWQGPSAPIKLLTPSERMFRTQLTTASKQPPDFAGHYRFTAWGCGSFCVAGALINLKTGVVFSPPLGAKGGGWNRWIFCGGIIDGPYVDYRPDSSLMIVHCQEQIEDTTVHYLVWENTGFRQILRAVLKNKK